MDNRIIDVLTAIRDMYGDGIFYNHTKTKNLLHDLSPSLPKERIQVTNFLEMNGYFQLKYAGRSYQLIRSRLIRNYINTYAVGEQVAAWVVDVFGALLGYNDIKTGAQYQRESGQAGPSAAIFSSENADIDPSFTDAHWESSADTDENAKTVPLRTVSGGLSPALPYANRIAADYHSVAITRDGRVLAAGPNEDGQCNTFAWRNMVAVSAGAYFTVGLRKDGTVTAVGRNDYGQCNVRQWTDICAISAGVRHTVGLRADGSVVATGQNKNGECNVHNWRNVIQVTAGCQCTFGVKKDRRVLVKGRNKADDLMVSHLSNVNTIANAAPNRAVALLMDGTVVRVGREDHMHKDFARWSNIRQLSAAPDYFAGLCADGTVKILAYFWEDSGVECSADDWRDIVSIAAGRYHLLGLRKDGVVLAAMMHPDYSLNKGQCNVANWEV